MKHGAGGPKHSEEVSANQLLLRALAGQSPGAITPASSESLSRREEEEEEEEEKEGERKPRATPKEEREVAAGSGHCRDGWTLPVGQILGRRTQPTDRPLILLAVRLFRRDKHLARGGNSEGYPQISGAETRAACAQPVPLPAPDSR
ncbi:uncharacterized protein LOC134148452 isoform X23 [Rhea pennata]|uniref:uncharacterized protein LOC134148452 isoform X23 n=1 Tax=Rhea pennata TaxID=8795 RepID=UPI002E261193